MDDETADRLPESSWVLIQGAVRASLLTRPPPRHDVASRLRRPKAGRTEREERTVAERLDELRRLAEVEGPIDPGPMLVALADPEPSLRRAAAWAVGTRPDVRRRLALE